MTEGLLVFVKWVVSSPWRRKPTVFYPSRVSRRPCPVAWHSTLTLTHTKRRPKCLEQSSSKTLLDCSIFTTQSSRNMPFTLQSDLPVHRAYVISHCGALLGDVVLQQKLSLIQLLSFFLHCKAFFFLRFFRWGSVHRCCHCAHGPAPFNSNDKATFSFTRRRSRFKTALKELNGKTV